MSGEEILSEYFNFLRNLPDLISSEKQKIVNIVKKEWNIDHLLENIHKLDFERHLMNIGEGNNLIDQLSTKLGQSLRVICPPVKNCLLCNKNLAVNNRPTQVIAHTLNGPTIFTKYILRCKNCHLTSKKNFVKGDSKIREAFKINHWRKFGTQIISKNIFNKFFRHFRQFQATLVYSHTCLSQ